MLGFPMCPAPWGLTVLLPSSLSERSWLTGTQVTTRAHTDLRPPQDAHGPQPQPGEGGTYSQGHGEGDVYQLSLPACVRCLGQCVWEEGMERGRGVHESLWGSGQGVALKWGNPGGFLEEAGWSWKEQLQQA